VTSFCTGVRDKRYNGQLETASYSEYCFEYFSVVIGDS
jgi:hypothetical protein